MSVRRLLRPAWLLTHLLVVAAFVVMVNLGFWQLRRLDARQAHNAVVEERMSQPVGPFHEVVDLVNLEESANRPVEVRGVFDPGREVYVMNRTRDGLPGVHVVTLMEGGFGAVVVDRGFLPRPAYLGGEEHYWAPGGGEVVVTGWIRLSRTSRFGNGDEVDVVDIADLSGRWGVALLPAYVQATAGAAAGDYPLRPQVPDLTSGPHLGYAVQWFVFAVIALVGYPLVLVRITRDDQLVA